MKIAVLQLSSQGLSSTKLLNYVRIAHKKNVKLLLLGEYILNPFFHELRTLSLSMIREQTKQQLNILKDLAKTYNMTLIAPLIKVEAKKIYKVTAKVSPSSTGYYKQQILINYPHWNEERYFDNPLDSLTTPYIFKIENTKFAIINGFELHFDAIFAHLDSKKIDCILVPSVSTFESYERWKSLIAMRSFTHNCYIVRANRIGEYKDKEHIWNFYGDSICTSPNGELLTHLGNKEELMIVDVSHIEVKNARKSWGFYDTIQKRHTKG